MSLWICVGALSGFIGISMGAFGAHALAAQLSEKSLSVFHTAAQYQMIHALALFGVGIWQAQPSAPGFWVEFSGWAFALGTLLFSGSLYALALTDIKILGAITPLGGLLFLAGWVSLAVSGFKTTVN